jgi:hypothetical protein
VLIIQNAGLQLRLDAFRALLLELHPFKSLEEFQKFLGIPIITDTDPALDEVRATYEDCSRALLGMHLAEMSENLQIRTDYCTDYCTAVHESGHAVAAIVLGFGLLSRGARIVPEKPEDDDMTLDMTHSQVSHPSSRRWLRKRVVLAMAGGIAEQCIRENGWHNGRHRDVDQVQDRISQLAGNLEAFTALKQELLAEATELISRHWESIVCVVDRLDSDAYAPGWRGFGDNFDLPGSHQFVEHGDVLERVRPFGIARGTGDHRHAVSAETRMNVGENRLSCLTHLLAFANIITASRVAGFHTGPATDTVDRATVLQSLRVARCGGNPAKD